MVSVHRGIVVSLLVAIALLVLGVVALLWVSHSRQQRYQNELQDIRRELLAKENELKELRRQLHQPPAPSPTTYPATIPAKPIRPTLSPKLDTTNDGWSWRNNKKARTEQAISAIPTVGN